MSISLTLGTNAWFGGVAWRRRALEYEWEEVKERPAAPIYTVQAERVLVLSGLFCLFVEALKPLAQEHPILVTEWYLPNSYMLSAEAKERRRREA